MAGLNCLWHSLIHFGVINAANTYLDSNAYCLAGLILTVFVKNESWPFQSN